MSKSSENFILPENLFNGNSELIEKGFDPMVVKFLMYQAHYRNTLDLSNESLLAAEKGYKKLIKSYLDIDNLRPSNDENVEFESIIKKCYESMMDDFNSPKLISHLFEISRIIENVKKEKNMMSKKSISVLKSHLKVFLIDILGFSVDINNDKKIGNSDELISAMIEIRDFSRKNKNYEISDFIRNKLNSFGINLNDN